jgi:hypothetical protein
MNWRPKGWVRLTSTNESTELLERMSYEQGADAMLEALRKTGKRSVQQSSWNDLLEAKIDDVNAISAPECPRGFMVFIPDD